VSLPGLQSQEIARRRGTVTLDSLLRREGTSRNGWQPTADALLTMEVSVRHARTRAATSDTVLPAKSASVRLEDASRDVARVVSDVSVLCPRFVV
jgi:hypothetical protein